jgi:hypothetical protein
LLTLNKIAGLQAFSLPSLKQFRLRANTDSFSHLSSSQQLTQRPSLTCEIHVVGKLASVVSNQLSFPKVSQAAVREIGRASGEMIQLVHSRGSCVKLHNESFVGMISKPFAVGTAPGLLRSSATL